MGETRSEESDPKAHFRTLLQIFSGFSPDWKSQGFGIADSHRQPVQTADFAGNRTNPQIFCRNRFLPFNFSRLALSHNGFCSQKIAIRFVAVILVLTQARAAKGPHRRKPRKPLRFISGEVFSWTEGSVLRFFLTDRSQNCRGENVGAPPSHHQNEHLHLSP